MGWSDPQPGGDRLLIVEDDATAAALLARALGRHGYRAQTAASVREALAASEGGPLQAAIIDLRLDKHSGLPLVPALLSAHPGIRVLVLTGYASVTTAVEAMRMGAADYLSKPVNVTDILVALRGERAMTPELTSPPGHPSVRLLEWEYIQKVLADHDGNVSKTARALGMQRRTLQRKLAKRPPRS